MDVRMPGTDGFEAARVIKAKSGNRFIPIIFITAFADGHSLADCIAAGGDDFLIKPFDEIIFRSRVLWMQRVSLLNSQQWSTDSERFEGCNVTDSDTRFCWDFLDRARG